jgi:hypothetical protein
MPKLIIDSKKMSDTGQVLTLICILLFLFTSYQYWLITALTVLVINMVCPLVFKPLVFCWFGFAEILGFVVSRIVLTLVFVLLVIPVGLLRYFSGSDPMRLKEWKQYPTHINHQNKTQEIDGNDSVFIVRNHRYTVQDIINPY